MGSSTLVDRYSIIESLSIALYCIQAAVPTLCHTTDQSTHRCAQYISTTGGCSAQTHFIYTITCSEHTSGTIGAGIIAPAVCLPMMRCVWLMHMQPVPTEEEATNNNNNKHQTNLLVQCLQYHQSNLQYTVWSLRLSRFQHILPLSLGKSQDRKLLCAPRFLICWHRSVQFIHAYKPNLERSQIDCLSMCLKLSCIH